MGGEMFPHAVATATSSLELQALSSDNSRIVTRIENSIRVSGPQSQVPVV